MKYNQNILTRKLRIAEMGAKQLCNLKSYTLLIALAVLTGTLFSMPAISSLMSNVTIRSSGTIVTISPLHVEGKYIKNGLNQTFGWVQQCGRMLT
ncbi:MAG: hypothetical protein ACTSQ8_21515 [Candidatus Helarchaeota archaeon]